MKSGLFLLLAAIFGFLALPVSAQDASPTPPRQPPDAKSPTPPPGCQIKVSRNLEQPEPSAADGESVVFEMNQLIRIGVGGQLANDINAARTNNSPSVPHHLKLYLDGVSMAVPDPVILSPEAFVSPDGAAFDCKLVLQFILERDSSDDASRKAWDTLLPRLHLGSNPVEVDVGLNDGIPCLASSVIHFQVRDTWKVVTVILSGLVVFFLLMYWAVRTSMLREAGTNTAYSLGKSQMAFWGFLVLVSFTGVWIIGRRMEHIPAQVLILLGISGTTGLGSVLIGNGKQSAASDAAQGLKKKRDDLLAENASLTMERDSLLQVQAAGSAQWTTDKQQRLAVAQQQLGALSNKQTEAANALNDLAAAARPANSCGYWLKDIVTDANGVSFYRLQVVLWTVVLGVVFVANVSSAFTMPEFESTLLVLMGISNGTYLGFKIPEKPS